MRIPIILLTLIFFSFSPVDNCDNKLEDGKYKAVVTTKGYENFEVRIDKDQFLQTFKDGRQILGRMERVDCDIVLKTERQKISFDTLDMAERQLYFMGDLCYEFEKTRGRKTKFRLTRIGSRHVTINEGQFIRLKLE